MLTTALICLPLFGALAVFLLPAPKRWVGSLALFFSLAELSLWISGLTRFDFGSAKLQFEQQHSWISDLGISYHVGLFGFSLWLVGLTVVVMTAAIAYGLWAGRERANAYYALMLFLTAAIRQLAPLDPILIAPISLFPVLGVVMFWAMTRREGRRVVEFTCDEGSFRFRKVGSAQAETRALSEVARVQEVSERAGLIGYELIFRDGHKVFLERRLPNAEAAADWLRSHRQP